MKDRRRKAEQPPPDEPIRLPFRDVNSHMIQAPAPAPNPTTPVPLDDKHLESEWETEATEPDDDAPPENGSSKSLVKTHERSGRHERHRKRSSRRDIYVEAPPEPFEPPSYPKESYYAAQPTNSRSNNPSQQGAPPPMYYGQSHYQGYSSFQGSLQTPPPTAYNGQSQYPGYSSFQGSSRFWHHLPEYCYPDCHVKRRFGHKYEGRCAVCYDRYWGEHYQAAAADAQGAELENILFNTRDGKSPTPPIRPGVVYKHHTRSG